MARIALDAMGGDHAPAATVGGALAALDGLGIRALLVGDTERIHAELTVLGRDPGEFDIVDAREVIGMDEHPATALRQKHGSSIAVAAALVRDGKADALVSMGNSGATMAAGVLIVGRAEGVERPAMAALLPGFPAKTLLLDAGANADCTPRQLAQFAAMGSAYMERVQGVREPRVALLNMGAEPGKGDRMTQEAYELLKESAINFVGNIEGLDLLLGKVDVAVCDGFTGNVALKTMEGVGDFALSSLRGKIRVSPRAIAGAFLLKPVLKALVREFDYA